MWKDQEEKQSDWAALMLKKATDSHDRPLNAEERMMVRLIIDDYARSKWLKKKFTTGVVWLGGIATACTAIWQFVQGIKK